nr:PREDICTED: protein sly1 homolog [Bemisia tabaci]
MATIKERQTAALRQMLNLNESQPSTISYEPVWKVLVYDRFGQDIILPLISVKELRELGVTLYVQLHSDRDPIPDVPAIYFCMPSEENLDRIRQDFQNGIYDMYHLNFISAISRQKLEDLAAAAFHSNCVASINKVFDQYLNFISLEDDLFILRQQDCSAVSYYAMNKGDIKDSEMEAIMDTIVESLFSVFVTMSAIPVIRSPKGNAAEMVAEKLDKKLRENLRDSRNSLFLGDVAGAYNFQRPLLIILDRNLDMATPLHHTWTYQALIHDVLDLSLNKVVVKEASGKSPGGGARSKAKACHLDNTDSFWVAHKASPFPIVAEAIQEELEQLRASEDEVKNLKAAMGVDNDNEAAFTVMDSTAKLTSAVSSLPQHLEKKRLIDTHTTIATAVLNSIKSRRLDTLFELEEKIMSRASLDRSIMDIITDPESGTSEDKVRMFIIYYICNSQMSEVEFDHYCSALKDQGCELEAIMYIKRWKAYVKMAAAPNQYTGGGTKTVSMFSKLVSQGSSFVMEGVKNLVIKRHNLPVTRIVDEIMEGREADGQYRYFDPKQLRPVNDPPRSNLSQFTQAIVFIVGGGNYIEYQNLIDYAKGKWSTNPSSGISSSKKVIYGASTLDNAKQFLKQLSTLGQELR